MSIEETSAGESRGNTLQVTTRLLRRFLPGEARGLAIGVLLMLVTSAAALVQPWPLKIVLDSVVGRQPLPALVARLVAPFAAAGVPEGMTLLTITCATLLLIEVLLAVSKILNARVMTAIALRLVFRLRCALFDHIQRQSLAFHDAKSLGDSLYRVTWDSYCLQAIFSGVLMPALTAALTLAGIVAVMLTRDWRLAVAALAAAGPLVWLIRRLERPMTEQSLKVHDRESGVSTRVQETLIGIRAVQAFGREEFESERFRTQADASLRANLRLTVLQTVAQSAVGLVIATATAAVIWISARDVLLGRVTAGDLVLLVAYAAMIFKPLETLAYTAATAQNAGASARRVLSVLDAMPEVADLPHARPLARRAQGRLEFEHVSFSYRAGQPVLRDITLTIEPHTAVALVGLSGAGKTTLASLVPRFYDPSEGRVTLDGQDLRALTLQSLRKNIALVTQDPVLFCASIRDNIAYGRADATDDEIEAAARAAGAHEFIVQLPEGYETRLAERGVTLSGGQRQRLAIARAFLKNAPVLILDEPTSALDAETEEHLLQSMRKLMVGRTTVVIAHRLSTVRFVDRIIVLRAGAIVETGTENELLARNGVYARLHALQFGPKSARFATTS
jgi:ABC-type multidrug transport system fused ATPase/permease subunit